MAKTTGRIRKEQKPMSVEYDQYLAEHIGNVHKGLQWMDDNLPLSKEEKEAIWEAMIMHTHDASKYDKDEYDAYNAYFYGGNRSYKVVQDFHNAWLRHIHKNPHHWQYWVLLEDDPENEMREKPLMMPLDYIFEMIADWWTFSWRSNNLFEMFAWYAEHRDKQIMHPQTRRIVEQILKKMWDVLIMQAAREGKDTMDIEQQYMKFWMGQEMLAQKNNEKYEDLIEASEITAEDWAKVTAVGTDDPNLDGKVAYTFHGIDIPYVYIEHTGIKGQKWGVRRFQNYDGSLTEAGRERYGRTVFVSGSSKTQTEESPYYRKELPKEVKNELDKHIKNHDKILVGDAPGIDRQVQDYLNSKDYDGVEVYGPGKQVRYSANEKWKTNAIDDPDHEEGSKEWLAKKDKAMSDAADEGLAVILDEGAKATRNNVARMLEDEKDVKVFELSKDGPAHDGMHTINQLFKERRDILDRKLDDDFDQELVDLIGAEMLDSLGLYDELDRVMKHSDLSEDEEDKHKYGVPEQKKFPMPDKDHVKSAIRFFNYVDPKYEQELADAILERAEEYGLVFGEDITVGDDNKFKKYLPKEES